MTDYLDTDIKSLRHGQKWFLYSFIRPRDDIVKLKFMHDFHLFMKHTQRNAKLRSSKTPNEPSIYEHYMNNLDKYDENFLIRYLDKFRVVNSKLLNSLFNKKYPDRSTEVRVPILKVYGTYNDREEQTQHLELLKETERKYKIYVGMCGYWTESDPPETSESRVCYNDDRMNSLMKSHLENNIKTEKEFVKRRRILQQKALADGLLKGENESKPVNVYNKETGDKIVFEDIPEEELNLEYMKYSPYLEDDVSIKSKDNVVIEKAKKMIIDEIKDGFCTATPEILKEFDIYDEYADMVKENIRKALELGRKISDEHLKSWGLF